MCVDSLGFFKTNIAKIFLGLSAIEFSALVIRRVDALMHFALELTPGIELLHE